jgi:hypothetical protein
MKRTRPRRIRRLIALAVATAAIVRFAYGRRAKHTTPEPAGRADWASLALPKGEPAPAALTAGSTTHAALVPVAKAEPAQAEVTAAAADAPWVDPIDGACPLSHPIKGNANSGIYHRPGGQFYEQTIPERCYRDAEAAEADGMRASKR